MNLCVSDSEEREYGVSTGVYATILSETLQVISIRLEESDTRSFRLQKKTMNLCAYDSEECEDVVGAGVNATILSETLEVVSFLSLFILNRKSER